ncbi:MAG: non-ribosomal peptide synthetase, partial [Chloroflexi bacterium]|nr:non-ribosomal peptide synthetase [Chloroflexota bacterium]
PPGLPAPLELGELLARERVTTLWLTAGLFHQVVERQLDSLGGLRQLLAGGDVLSARHVKRVLERHEGVRLINGYGPTEGTTFTCCHPMTDASQVGQTVPIGRPIANTRVYVLDGHRQLVPIGVPGELCIGGDGVARGYFGRPDLTAARFVPNPFDESGERLYRTGDLARYRPDGVIEFLGRIDDQVKIRGHRVEPGEIEAVLVEHHAVQDAVVVASEDRAGHKRLVAYVVPRHGDEPTGAELRSHLKATLPDYMVPTAFVVMDVLPLTANGKVDRSLLPPPPWDLGAARPTVAPRTPLEERLAAIWTEVLGVDRVGIDDDFFERGGHSLTATQLVARVRDEFGVDLKLTAL